MRAAAAEALTGFASENNQSADFLMAFEDDESKIVRECVKLAMERAEKSQE